MPAKTYHFNLDKETKRTQRFAESGSSDIGVIYLQKHVWAQLGSPQSIVVTIDKK